MAKKKLLVGGKKKPVPARSVILNAVKADFRATAVKSAMKDFEGAWPGIREHAFAKTQGQKVRGASIRKYRHRVRRRVLRPDESFFMHTHPLREAMPSFGDMANILNKILEGRKPFEVIESLDDSAAVNRFLDLTLGQNLSRSLQHQNPLSKAESITSARKAAVEAAKLIQVVGRTHVKATKIALNMNPQKMQSLIDYLCKQQDALDRNRLAMFESTSGKIQTICANTRRNIQNNYGKEPLFKYRFVSAKGYRYDKKKKKFVKAKS